MLIESKKMHFYSVFLYYYYFNYYYTKLLSLNVFGLSGQLSAETKCKRCANHYRVPFNNFFTVRHVNMALFAI
jgi:hypothetical protein